MQTLLLLAYIASSSFAAAEPESFVGTVRPVPQLYYRGSPENGYPVTKINVRPGDQVKAGDVVIELDPAVLPLNLRKAQVEVAEGELKVLLNRKVIRQKMLERQRRLIVTGATSGEELDIAQENTNCLDAEIERAKAAIKAAKVAYEQADFVHTNYEIMKSPIDGVVTFINCALGQCGRAEMGPVWWIEIVDPSRVQVHFSVPLKVAQQIKVGTPVLIRQDDFVKKDKVLAVIKMADSSGNIPVIVETENPGHTLVCGTKVRVSIDR